jgi:hypothetical protein
MNKYLPLERSSHVPHIWKVARCRYRHAHLSVCRLSACNISRTAIRIFMKFDTGQFY